MRGIISGMGPRAPVVDGADTGVHGDARQAGAAPCKGVRPASSASAPNDGRTVIIFLLNVFL
jgi:hypothetical protein